MTPVARTSTARKILNRVYETYDRDAGWLFKVFQTAHNMYILELTRGPVVLKTGSRGQPIVKGEFIKNHKVSFSPSSTRYWGITEDGIPLIDIVISLQHELGIGLYTRLGGGMGKPNYKIWGTFSDKLNIL